ncbi:hypothetical protein EGT07_17365 [Herbaspirillum sp. HC18]|nr:hypothetical protein EGT07_17365 [Herbaspirillum sp. HC18]
MGWNGRCTATAKPCTLRRRDAAGLCSVKQKKCDRAEKRHYKSIFVGFLTGKQKFRISTDDNKATSTLIIVW